MENTNKAQPLCTIREVNREYAPSSTAYMGCGCESPHQQTILGHGLGVQKPPNSDPVYLEIQQVSQFQDQSSKGRYRPSLLPVLLMDCKSEVLCATAAQTQETIY